MRDMIPEHRKSPPPHLTLTVLVSVFGDNESIMVTIAKNSNTNFLRPQKIVAGKQANNQTPSETRATQRRNCCVFFLLAQFQGPLGAHCVSVVLLKNKNKNNHLVMTTFLCIQNCTVTSLVCNQTKEVFILDPTNRKCSVEFNVTPQ